MRRFPALIGQGHWYWKDNSWKNTELVTNIHYLQSHLSKRISWNYWCGNTCNSDTTYISEFYHELKHLVNQSKNVESQTIAFIVFHLMNIKHEDRIKYQLSGWWHWQIVAFAQQEYFYKLLSSSTLEGRIVSLVGPSSTQLTYFCSLCRHNLILFAQDSFEVRLGMLKTATHEFTPPSMGKLSTNAYGLVIPYNSSRPFVGEEIGEPGGRPL